MLFDEFWINKFTLSIIGAVSQMNRADTIEFKIVIASILFWINKKFDTTVPMCLTVRFCAFRQDVFFDHIKFQPNLVLIMGNP